MKIFSEVVVVGMHYREREGVPAKSIVANLVPPVALTLEREPENQHDEYAIKVLYGNQHIGYIEASAACYIAPWLDDGEPYRATVDTLLERKNNLHPVLTVVIGDDEPA